MTRPDYHALARQRFGDPSKRRGILVAFDGPDGSGKTTQRKLFRTWLQSEGHDVVTTKWNSSDLIKPIIKALWEGKTVIADRFLFTGLSFSTSNSTSKCRRTRRAGA
jgi:thymidylate kinase